MAFFGLQVSQKTGAKKIADPLSATLHLSTVVLENTEQDGVSKLYIKDTSAKEQPKIALAVLRGKTVESSVLNHYCDPETTEFSVVGPHTLHVSGYYEPADGDSDSEKEDEDEEEDSEEEESEKVDAAVKKAEQSVKEAENMSEKELAKKIKGLNQKEGGKDSSPSKTQSPKSAKEEVAAKKQSKKSEEEESEDDDDEEEEEEDSDGEEEETDGEEEDSDMEEIDEEDLKKITEDLKRANEASKKGGDKSKESQTTSTKESKTKEESSETAATSTSKKRPAVETVGKLENEEVESDLEGMDSDDDDMLEEDEEEEEEAEQAEAMMAMYNELKRRKVEIPADLKKMCEAMEQEMNAASNDQEPEVKKLLAEKKTGDSKSKKEKKKA